MKLENKTGHIQIPLSQLRITSNVRTDFDESEIAELAQSIKENGLINAITVKPPVTDGNGEKTYEVIAGGRRIRAHQWLCEHGDDFSMVDCKIVTGDMWTLQMIENIQRTDLTPRDKENAIAAALDQGLTQTQIADRLSKPIQYVNDIVAGAKVRKLADAAFLNTDGVSTKALAQLRGIPENELTAYIEGLCMRGGSVAMATALLHEWKAKQAEKELAKETPHGDFTPPAPTTPGSGCIASSSADARQMQGNVSEPDRTAAHCPPAPVPGASDGLEVGDEVQGLGERLRFADLSEGMYIIDDESTESLTVHRLCKIIRVYDGEDPAVEFDTGAGDAHHSFARPGSIDGDAPSGWVYAVSLGTHKVGGYAPEPNAGKDDENERTPEAENGEYSEYQLSRDKIEGRFIMGTEIDRVGRRLFFKDLWNGRKIVTHVGNRNNIVCAIASDVQPDSKGVTISYWKDKETRIDIYSARALIDDETTENGSWFLYEIPDDAKEVAVPDFQPKPKKGLQNPISRQIQVCWQTFGRSKKIPEDEKTAFRFYQELLTHFEGQ